MTNIIKCTDCPRNCNINARFCGKDIDKIRVAKVMRHFYEEPIICPEKKGSGAIFFSHCSLKCSFCQNYPLSHDGLGKDFTEDELLDIFKKVENSNVANLNLVTPTHYTGKIISVLKKAQVKIPVVWNTSGYESVENIKKLNGIVDIFLFDFKYFDSALSIKYSKVKDYFDKCMKALKTAREIIPNDVIENNVMKKGIIIRHLVLPTHTEDSKRIFEEIKKQLGTDVIISVMSQYVPMYKSCECDEINRNLKVLEYKKVLKVIDELGFKKGFIQELSSAKADYTPDFNLSKFYEL